jgi:hypothetical protein
VTDAINLDAGDMERLNKQGRTAVKLNGELIIIRAPQTHT